MPPAIEFLSSSFSKRLAGELQRSDNQEQEAAEIAQSSLAINNEVHTQHETYWLSLQAYSLQHTASVRCRSSEDHHKRIVIAFFLRTLLIVRAFTR
jgi:hypothetical protein